MTLELERLFNEGVGPEPTDQGTAATNNGLLVINLCKVGAPITIPQPRSPQLSRFSFFLSHGWQGGRRRYRLQMGYFSTHGEADKWLQILRTIYPGAFVSDLSAAQTEPLSDTQVARILEHRGTDEPRRTFEETLQILGTSELDVGGQDEIKGTAGPDLRIELQNESPHMRKPRRSILRMRKL